MHAQTSARKRSVPPLAWLATAVVLAAICAGCGFGPLPGRATEEWTKTYPLTEGGEVRIANTNGKVEIEGVDASTVEVHVQKIARGTTDEAARQLLPRITITEEVKPDRVALETARIAGLMIGVGFEVQYHIKAPRHAAISARTTNGGIVLNNLSGKVVARTTNGGVRATALSGPVEAESTNGGVQVDVASVGRDPIALRTTNGGVTLDLPDTAKADVVATWTNGGMSVNGLSVDVTERSRRRFEGKLNGGGAPIELHTTNGGIRLRAREVEAQKPADERR
jgi:DUF4097 and DUF4098 domain-containing protein YvlB